MWINTVYNDDQVQGSDAGPVVYLSNGTGSPLLGYAELAQCRGAAATVGQYLSKLSFLEHISVFSFPGAHGSVILLNNYLSTIFEVSDVMVDKEEIAMILKIGMDLPEKTDKKSASFGVSENDFSVSNPYTEAVLQKVGVILTVQGFPCPSCPYIQYKLSPLSHDCKGNISHSLDTKAEYKALLVISCGENEELFRFELRLLPDVEGQ